MPGYYESGEYGGGIKAVDDFMDDNCRASERRRRNGDQDRETADGVERLRSNRLRHRGHTRREDD
jgi:hypothetical protein